MTQLFLGHSWRSHYTSFLLCCNITRGFTWFRHDSTKIHSLLHHSIRSNHKVKSQTSQHKTASGANIYWDTCGSPVIKCLCFLSSFVFLDPPPQNGKNCAIVPSGHWALNTMTTNCDPIRCSHADHAWYLDDDWRCHARTGPGHMTNHEIFAYRWILCLFSL